MVGERGAEEDVVHDVVRVGRGQPQFLLDHPQFTVNVMHQVVRRFRSVVTSAPQD